MGLIYDIDYGKDIIKNIKSKMNGNVKKLMDAENRIN